MMNLYCIVILILPIYLFFTKQLQNYVNANFRHSTLNYLLVLKKYYDELPSNRIIKKNA